MCVSVCVFTLTLTHSGVNVANAWVNDLVVLTDYLSSLPFVDPKRVGVAGCSGGGVQAAYVGAMDERMSVASIAW